jgi:hypothetical protein
MYILKYIKWIYIEFSLSVKDDKNNSNNIDYIAIFAKPIELPEDLKASED